MDAVKPPFAASGRQWATFPLLTPLTRAVKGSLVGSFAMARTKRPRYSPCRITTFAETAHLVRQVADAQGVDYDETPVPGKDHVDFAFKKLDRAATYKLVSAMPKEVFVKRAIGGARPFRCEDGERSYVAHRDAERHGIQCREREENHRRSRGTRQNALERFWPPRSSRWRRTATGRSATLLG